MALSNFAHVSYLQNISRLSNADNLGGLLTIQVVRKADVESIPDPSGGTVYGDIILAAGKSFVTWLVTMESQRTKSQSRNTREGSSKGNNLEFLIPKDRPEIKLQLDQAEEDEFIILYTDSNGKAKLFGLLDTPVKFSYDHDTGALISDSNAYQCRFYYDGPDNLYHYNGALPSPPVGASPAIVLYNGSPIASLLPGETLNIISDFGFTDFYITS